MYQPHPAFGQRHAGRYRYHTDHALTRAELAGRRSPWEFEQQGTRELVARRLRSMRCKRHATTRIEAPVYAVFAEYVIGLKRLRASCIKREDAKLLAAGLPEDLQDKPFLDFQPLAAGGRASDRPPHRLSHPPEGQVPAMALLDGDAVHRADAAGGRRRSTRKPGMAEAGLSLEPVAGGHRPVHDAHLRARPTARARAQPQLPRRHLSVQKASRNDKARGLLDDCGKATPFVDTPVRDDRKENARRARRSSSRAILDVPEIERPERGVLQGRQRRL